VGSVEQRGGAGGAGRWCPLLGEADRATVREVACAIACELQARPRSYSFGRGHDLALADGDAGIALLFAELPGYREAAEVWIARAIDGIAAEVAIDASLHLGFTGIAWAWMHVMHGDDQDDALAEVDLALLELLRHPDARLAPGLLFGLSGIAIYALDRANQVADACLVAIVDRLLATAEAEPGGGLRWWLPPPPGTGYVERFPDGFYDLGLDVGAAGVVAACARIAGRGVAVTGARELMTRATRWIVGQDTPRGLPSKLGPGDDAVHGFGWCKGELGVAVGLLGAGLAADDRTLVDRAVALGCRAALVEPASCCEPGLHIGAAGALHGFNRLYQATRLPRFRDAALRWLVRLLELRLPGTGIAGFASPDGRASQGLVQGAAGIGLALLAAAAERAPSWDRALGA
jgi:lantibiotic biosynthesis protein